MRKRILLITAIFLSALLVGCSNLFNDLSFSTHRKAIETADESLTETKVDASVEGEGGIVTVSVDGSGRVILTSVRDGKTAVKVTVKGYDKDGAFWTTTSTYEVTVGKDGSIWYGKKGDSVSEMTFPEKEERLEPDEGGIFTEAKSNDESVVAVKVNEDGSITLTSLGEGSATVTVRGRDANGDDVTLTYTVTVAANGEIDYGEPVVFKNQSKTLNPKSDAGEKGISGFAVSGVTVSGEGDSNVVTAETKSDGTVTIVSQGAGSTKVMVNGKDSSGDTVSLVYSVTVAGDGTVTVDGTPTVFRNQSLTLPRDDDTAGITGFKISDITNSDSDGKILTAEKTSDGKAKITSQGPGEAAITLTGSDSNGDSVTMTYTVTVGNDGAITVSEPVVFKIQNKIVSPKEFLSTVDPTVVGFDITNATCTGNAVSMSQNDDANGDDSVTLTTQESGKATVKIRGRHIAKDINGNVYKSESMITLTYEVNVKDDGSIEVGDPSWIFNAKRTFDLLSYDPDFETFTGDFVSENENVVDITLDNESKTITFIALEQGKTSVTVKGKDKDDTPVTISVSIEVNEYGNFDDYGFKLFWHRTVPIASIKDDYPTMKLETVTVASPLDDGVLSVTVDVDGNVKVTSQKAGTAAVVFTGTLENGDTVKYMNTYEVQENGEVWPTDSMSYFIQTSKTVNPSSDAEKAGLTGFKLSEITCKVTSSVTDIEDDVFTFIKNNDGTVTVTPEGWQGDGYVIAMGTCDGSPVTLKYILSAPADGLKFTNGNFYISDPEITLTITFNANGGSGTMDYLSVKKGESCYLTENKFTPPAGCEKFLGWATSADGEKLYDDGVNVYVTKSMTLYAKWLKIYSDGDVGDIVLSDGKYITAENYTTYKDTLLAERNEKPIAVIFYNGTSSDPLGAKRLGVGYYRRECKQWCTESANGNSVDIESIRISSGENGLTGDSDGSDNLEAIGKFLATHGSSDDTTTKVSDALPYTTTYPAFESAMDYARQLLWFKSIDITQTVYASGWYLPSLLELLQFEFRVETLDATFEALGVESFVEAQYWTSSQVDSGDYEKWDSHDDVSQGRCAYIGIMYESGDRIVSSFSVMSKADTSATKYVCAIRVFE